MSVVINGHYSNEVAATTLAAAQLEGLGLQYNSSGVLAPATTRFDAVLLSEVVSATEFTNRFYLFHDIDFGPYTQIGEPSSVAKDVNKRSCLGLLVNTASTLIAAGKELIFGSAGTAGYLIINPTQGNGAAVAIAIDAIPATATRTGLIHIL